MLEISCRFPFSGSAARSGNLFLHGGHNSGGEQLDLVQGIGCGPETRCYECLRNYRNQPYHDELERGVVRDFLQQVISAACIQA